MKLRHPWLIGIAAALIALVLRVYLWTLRIRTASDDGREHPSDPRETRYLYCFWHEGLLATLAKQARIRVLVSQHEDGELIAQVAHWLGFGTLRGSSTRGGARGLLEMLRCDEETHLGITPDGPRGPRRRLQPGAIFLSAESQTPIVPIGIGFTSAWRAPSWDRFAVPLPFSTLVGYVGAPLHVPEELDRAVIELQRQRVEAEMARVTAMAEAWAERLASGDEGPPRPAPMEEKNDLRSAA